jgi:hypothetical protein
VGPQCLQAREDVDDFTLRLSGPAQQLARHGDGDISEQKAVEKFLRIIPTKYTQIALSIETLLDLSSLSIEEVIGRLKAVDDRNESPPADPVSISGKMLFTKDQWLARQKERRGLEGVSLSKDRRKRPHKKDRSGSNSGGPSGGTGDRSRGNSGGQGSGGEWKATRDDKCLNCGRGGH